MREIVLAADLGGTNLRMAAVERSGQIVRRVMRPTPLDDEPMRIIKAIISLAQECRQAIESADYVCAIGVAVPATIDATRGIIHYAPNLQMLNGCQFSDEIKKGLDLNVILENDATAAAIGEHWLGASQDVDNSICVTLGTGVGGGIILNGDALRGMDGTAGEIGHICVEPLGVPCTCGSNGCVEQYSSATAIVRMSRELLPSYPKSLINGIEAFTSLDVYDAGVRGDELAIEVFRKMGYYLGIAAAGLVNVLNPEIIIFGGGMSAAWDLFIEHVREQIRKRAFRQPRERVKLVRAKLGDDAGILGAARLAYLAGR